MRAEEGNDLFMLVEADDGGGIVEKHFGGTKLRIPSSIVMADLNLRVLL